MSSGDYNICITQGKPYGLSITARDSNGDALDLTNYTFSGFFKTRYSENTALLACSGTGNSYIYSPAPTSGIVQIVLGAIDTAILPATKLIYDIEAHNNGSGLGDSVIELLRGRALVWPESTR